MVAGILKAIQEESRGKDLFSEKKLNRLSIVHVNAYLVCFIERIANLTIFDGCIP